MSSTHVNESQNAMHTAHLRGAVNYDTLTIPVGGGLFRYPIPDQAATAGYQRHVIHQLQPAVAPATTFFGGTNQYVDIAIPDDLDAVDKMDITLDLTNADASATAFNGVVSNLFSHYEIRNGAQILETVPDVEAWISQVVYTDPWEATRMETSSKIDPSTFKVDWTIPASTTASTVRVPLRNVITQCQIPTAALNSPLSIRLYSQNASNVITNTTNFQLTTLGCELREKRRLDRQIPQAGVARNLDYRYLKPKLEERAIALTSGSTVRTILQNFSESDLCSHLIVLIRTNAHTGLAQDDYLSIATQVWLEDEAGQNITNGIQWYGEDLLNFVYPDKFQNNAKSVHGIYIPFCPSQDPVGDFKKGLQTGVQALSSNMKLCINSSSSATYYVTVAAMCPRHVRVENGQITIR